MKILFIFLFFLAFSCKTQEISFCSDITVSENLNLASKCSNYSIFISNDLKTSQNIICLSSSNDAFLVLDLTGNIITTLSPEKTRFFNSSIDKCINLFSSDYLVCSNGNSLLMWRILTGDLNVYSNENFSLINDIKKASQSQAFLVIVRNDSEGFHVIDMQYLTINSSFPGDSFFPMGDGFICVVSNANNTVKTFKIINLANFQTIKQIDFDFDYGNAVYIENIEGFTGIFSSKNNTLYYWETNNSQNFVEIEEFERKISQLITFNSAILLIKCDDNSIFLYDLKEKKKMFLEKKASNDFNVIDYYNNLLLINSYATYLYNLTNRTINNYFPQSGSGFKNFISTTNKNVYTINQNLLLQKWDLDVCSSTKTLQNPNFNFSHFFFFEQDYNQVGYLQNSNENEIFVYNLDQEQISEYILETLSGLFCSEIISIPSFSFSNEKNLLLSCYDPSLSLSISKIYQINLNTRKIFTLPLENFECKIRNLLYMDFEDYIAFECNGSIYVYSIFHLSLIKKWAHLQNDFNGLFSMKQSANTIGSTSLNDVKIWDIYTGVLMKWIRNTNYLIESCISLYSQNSLCCIEKNSLTNTSSIKIWELDNLTLVSEIKDPTYSSNIEFSYFKLENFLSLKDCLIATSNKKIDIWNITSKTLFQSLSANLFTNSFIKMISSELLLIDFSPENLLIWDFVNQNQNKNISCLGNFYYNSTSDKCLKCGDYCRDNEFCSSSNTSLCSSAKCTYFFDVEGESLYKNCLETNQIKSVYLEFNNLCIPCKNVSKICYTEFCFSCEEGYFYNDSICLPCSSPCSNCFGPNETNCLSCDSSFPIFNEKNYSCEKKSTHSNITLIIVFSIFGGILLILLWCYFYHHHLKMMRKIKKYRDDKSVDEEVKIPVSAEYGENLISESYSNDDFFYFLSKSTDKFKENLKKNKQTQNQSKIYSFYLAKIEKNMINSFFTIRDSKENCFKMINDAVNLDMIGVGSLGEILLIENQINQKFTFKTLISSESDINIEKIEALETLFKENLLIKQNRIPTGYAFLGVGCNKSNKAAFIPFGVVQEHFEYNLGYFITKYWDDFNLKINLLKNLLLQVQELQKMNYIHGNLKSFNVLINYSENYLQNINAKPIIGLSDPKKFKNFDQILIAIEKLDKPKLRLIYIPPEFFFCNEDKIEYHEKNDIWGIGIIIFEMFYKDPQLFELNLPWLGELEAIIQEKEQSKRKELIDFVKNKILKEKESNSKNAFCNKKNDFIEITNIINECLQIKLEERIDIGKLIEKIENISVFIPKRSSMSRIFEF